jgi:hypothetical protein
VLGTQQALLGKVPQLWAPTTGGHLMKKTKEQRAVASINTRIGPPPVEKGRYELATFRAARKHRTAQVGAMPASAKTKISK